jgi:hypothetical protein
VEAIEDGAAVERVVVAEDLPQVAQQPHPSRGVLLLLGLGGRHDGRGGAGADRPVAAGEVGDGDQRLPGVGRTVLQRHRRLGVL